MVVKLMLPDTALGIGLGLRVKLPSPPFSLSPQQYTAPFVVRPQAWTLPALSEEKWSRGARVVASW